MQIIRKNAIRCNLCDEEIESTRTHEYVECKCGACAVDGRHDYLRRSAKTPDCYTDISDVVEIDDAKLREKFRDLNVRKRINAINAKCWEEINKTKNSQ